MKSVYIFTSLLVLTLCQTAHAAIVVDNEKITDIRVGPWGTESFAIKTTDDGDEENDEDHCVGDWVIFSRSNYPSGSNGDGSYDRAYTLALSAMSANQEISVDSIDDVACASAQTIGIGL